MTWFRRPPQTETSHQDIATDLVLRRKQVQQAGRWGTGVIISGYLILALAGPVILIPVVVLIALVVSWTTRKTEARVWTIPLSWAIVMVVISLFAEGKLNGICPWLFGDWSAWYRNWRIGYKPFRMAILTLGPLFRNWKYLPIPILIWWILVFLLGSWRMAAEVSDSTYPGPRNATDEPMGPRWPWTRRQVPDNLPPPPEVIYKEPVVVNVPGRKGAQQKRGDCPIPKAGNEARLDYFRALENETANLSNVGGQRKYGARRYRYIIPRELDELKTFFKSIGAAEDLGSTRGWELTESGKEYVRTVLRNHGIEPKKTEGETEEETEDGTESA